MPISPPWLFLIATPPRVKAGRLGSVSIGKSVLPAKKTSASKRKNSTSKLHSGVFNLTHGPMPCFSTFIMKAFVTGATGFVGSHVAHALSEQGAELRLLTRSSSPTKNIDAIRAERVAGDLTDPESLKKGMQGCEFVFHVAADYRLWVRDPEQMYRANVEGTRAILQAAQEAGVR